MREQKYRDILDKYEESLNSKSLEKESEEKLSMTRELKFKDLQESLIEEDNKEDLTMTRELKFLDKVKEATDISSNGEDEYEDEDEVTIDKESTLKESADIERELDEAIDREIEKQKELKVKDVHEEETKTSKIADDDIYLTTSFKPFKKRFRFRKVFKVLFILLILIGGIGALTYFVALPLYHKYIDSRPKMIFDHTIDYIDKEFGNVIDLIFTDDDIYYNDVNFKLDTNIDTLDILSDYTYGFQTAVSPKDKSYESFIYVKENNEKYGLRYVEKKLKEYANLTGSDNYMEIRDVEDDDNEFYNSYAKYLEELSLSKEDLKYLFHKELSILKELFEEDLLTSKKDEIVVNDKTTKVVKHSYTLNKKEAERIDKRFYELVKEDEKLVKILAESDELSEEEFLEQLEEEAIEDYEDDYKLVISIYTVNGTEFAGLDIEENGFRDLYFYTNEDNEFDFYINLTENEECLKGKDCVASDRKIYELEGRNKDKATEIVVKYNSIKYGVLKIDSFNTEKIKFDYEIFIKDKTIKGDVLLYLDNDKKEYNIDLSAKMDGQYINLKLFLGLKQNGQFGYINEDKIIKYTDRVFENEWNNFSIILKERGLDEGFSFWYMLNYHPDELLKSLGFVLIAPSEEQIESDPSNDAQTM